MCHADHFFQHNFYDFLIFLKRMLGFQEKCIIFRFTAKNAGKLRFFLVENGTIFSCAPEVKLFAN